MDRKNWNEAVRTERKGVPFITFPPLTGLPFLRHGFSTRLGGVSGGCLSSMNLSYSRGDNPEHVEENFARICSAIGVSAENLVFTDQVHDVGVCAVGRRDCLGDNLNQKKLSGVDGLVTNEPGVVLVTFHADCIPLYFADKEKKAIGLSHAGWRGTAGKIGLHTVKKMREQYGCRPEAMEAVIGPGICRDCYEVGEEVAAAFLEAFGKENARRILLEKGGGKYQLDLWEANRLTLLEAGLPADQIHVSGLCTCCDPALFFSHRASGGKRGNLAAFLSLC